MERESQSKKSVRSAGGGYEIFEYPRDKALEIAEQAAKVFNRQFKSTNPSLVYAAYNSDRSLLMPCVNYICSDGTASYGLVAEAPSGALALEIATPKEKVQTGDGVFTRWDLELRAPNWEIIAMERELR